MREKARQIAVRLLLCLVVGLQLGSASSCRIEATLHAAGPHVVGPHDVGPSASAELAALASVLGHPIALCHDASNDDHGTPGPSPHHGCCDCGICAATASLPPYANDGSAARIARQVDLDRSGISFVLFHSPRVAATSPRGPPLDV